MIGWIANTETRERAICPVRKNCRNFRTNGAILKCQKKNVFKLCYTVYLMTICGISYRLGLGHSQWEGEGDRQQNRPQFWIELMPGLVEQN